MSITKNTWWNQYIATTISESSIKASLQRCKSEKKINVYIKWKFLTYLRQGLLRLFRKHCFLFVIRNDWVYSYICLEKKEPTNTLYASIYTKIHRKLSAKFFKKVRCSVSS